MNGVEHLLREGIGLDAASIGSTMIQRTVRLRMKSLGLKRAEDYQRLLQTSPAEWAELVEAVVVTETWFFRDLAPFHALVRLVQEEWLPSHPAAPLRLLSFPCSSGEEPYSLAMALLEAGIPRERFQIDAIDLSRRALARAERAVYGRNSFRGKDLGYRDRWFHAVKDGFALAPAVRRCVRFAQANLLDAQFLAEQAPYDFVFCRNLLIYLDALTRRRALEKLQRLLAPAGVLFVGAAEQPLVLDQGFVSSNIPLAFACRKPDPATGCPRSQHPTRVIKLSPGSLQANALSDTSTQSAGAAANTGARRAAESSLQPTDAELARARRLADAGQLQEAATICEAHLKQQRGSAAAWYLLGLVREAAGDPAAADCYRKALYLEPNHYESLLQMALLSEKNGDTARARTYKRRAQRSQNSGPSAAT